MVYKISTISITELDPSAAYTVGLSADGLLALVESSIEIPGAEVVDNWEELLELDAWKQPSI